MGRRKDGGAAVTVQSRAQPCQPLWALHLPAAGRMGWPALWEHAWPCSPCPPHPGRSCSLPGPCSPPEFQNHGSFPASLGRAGLSLIVPTTLQPPSFPTGKMTPAASAPHQPLPLQPDFHPDPLSRVASELPMAKPKGLFSAKCTALASLTWTLCQGSLFPPPTAHHAPQLPTPAAPPAHSLWMPPWEAVASIFR